MIYLTNLTTREEVMKKLYLSKKHLTKQQYWTLKGQVKSGCYDEAMKGLKKILRRGGINE